MVKKDQRCIFRLAVNWFCTKRTFEMYKDNISLLVTKTSVREWVSKKPRYSDTLYLKSCLTNPRNRLPVDQNSFFSPLNGIFVKHMYYLNVWLALRLYCIWMIIIERIWLEKKGYFCFLYNQFFKLTVLK